MTTPPVIYDYSRLITRVLNGTPNGIDRLDLLLGEHFLGRETTLPLLFGMAGPRIVSRSVIAGALERVRDAWGERPTSADESSYSTAFRATSAPNAPARFEFRNSRREKTGRILAGLRTLARSGLLRGANPADVAPQDAIFLNATHFPMEWRRHVSWLDERRDIRPVLFIHDVLPVSKPDLFWRKEASKHRERLAFLARRGAAALVTSAVVEGELRAAVKAEGRNDLPIFRAAPPVTEAFYKPAADFGDVLPFPYFVSCGTIEPRKNHGMLMRVWMRLVEQHGPAAPRLFVVGKRGWLNEEILRALGAPQLRGFVFEVAGLPTPIYRRLLAGARALLAPSFDEGFGLTVAEALAAGVPVIASDIPAHRGQAGDLATLLDPQDDSRWHGAIAALAADAKKQEALTSIRSYRARDPATYLANLDSWLSDFARRAGTKQSLIQG